MANLIDDQKLQELFDQDVLEIIGGSNIPQEKKEELYQKMAQTIENRVIARIDVGLNDEERSQWVEVIDSGDKAKMEEFLKSKNIDVSKLMVQEALTYKMEIAALAQKSKE